MRTERKVLEDHLNRVLENHKQKRKFTEAVKNNLLEHKITPGESQKIISGTIPLNEIDIRILCLLTIAVYNETREESINPEIYFTDVEVKESETFEEFVEEKLEFPQTIDNVNQADVDDFSTIMSIKTLKKWFDSNLIQYNFDTQRNAKYIRKGSEVIKTPNVNPKSVKEIAEHLLDGTLLSTTLTFNIRAGSSDSGDDITYNAKERRLTINKGSICDVIDGFHRLSGVIQALSINPDINFNFKVTINNYNLRTAQNAIGQLNTINAMDTGHLKSLKESRQSDFVVKELQRNSSLRGKVSQTSKVTTMAGHWVSFNTLADAIDETFKLENKKDAIDISEYLTDFFDRLIPLIDNDQEDNLINHNVMFNGYITLANRLKENNIRFSWLSNIVNQIDFNRSNKLWRELGVLDEKNVVTNQAKKKIKEYFSAIDLEGVGENV